MPGFRSSSAIRPASPTNGHGIAGAASPPRPVGRVTLPPLSPKPAPRTAFPFSNDVSPGRGIAGLDDAEPLASPPTTLPSGSGSGSGAGAGAAAGAAAGGRGSMTAGSGAAPTPRGSASRVQLTPELSPARQLHREHSAVQQERHGSSRSVRLLQVAAAIFLVVTLAAAGLAAYVAVR